MPLIPSGPRHPLPPFAGLRPVLDTGDFDCWHAAVASRLGHHRSRRLADGHPFEARICAGAVGSFTLLHLQGRGGLRLEREQCGNAVLWLPLQGLTQERINGTDWLVEPGMGLLFRPGDQMDGSTSPEMAGISILLPPELLAALPAATAPLLDAGARCRQLLGAAREMAAAVAAPTAGVVHTAAGFQEALRQWVLAHDPAADRERLSARRRACTVAETRVWMEEHLAEPFQGDALASALGVSIRTLQYSFQSELGVTPIAELKRLRLRRLRQLLRDPGQRHRPIAALMLDSGLPATGSTAGVYRHWCGESPRDTRRR